MKKTITTIASCLLLLKVSAQAPNPTPHPLPMYQPFSATTYSVMPAGFATGVVTGAPASSQSAAQTSVISAAATLAPASAIQTNGGSYGLVNSGNGRFYVQHSASTSVGTNQLILAINTLNWSGMQISFDVEMINANVKTAGLVLQYRVGTTGTWTNVSGGVYSHSSSDRVNGQVDHFTSLTLPVAANNQAVVQLRWASWRGMQTGNHSGVAVDNVSIAAVPAGLPTLVSASTASGCSELFISEYVHDTLANRAIEIYNPTSISKSLTGYYLTVTTGTNNATYTSLSGTIPAYSTWVVANAKADTGITHKANQLVPNFNFSGADIIGLEFSSNPLVAMTIIDKIGDVNTPTVNGGWTVSSFSVTGSTKNQTLTRLQNIPRGNLEWKTAEFEWYPHPLHDYRFLGWHNSACNSSGNNPVANFKISPALQTSIYQDSVLGNTYSQYTYTLTLIGSTGWSQPIDVYYNSTSYYTNLAPSKNFTCTSPSAVEADWLYNPPGHNKKTFPQLPGGGALADTFQIFIDMAQIQGDMTSQSTRHLWLCMAVDLDPTIQPVFQVYDVGSDYMGNVYVSEDELNGIQTLFDNKQIKVYPNPFTDNFTIENKSRTNITKVAITDVLGREITNSIPKTNDLIKINTSDFSKGVYFVKVYSNNDSFTIKLIKE